MYTSVVAGWGWVVGWCVGWGAGGAGDRPREGASAARGPEGQALTQSAGRGAQRSEHRKPKAGLGGRLQVDRCGIRFPHVLRQGIVCRLECVSVPK